MPAGWGYSYLDWMGAYSFALAMLTGLFHRSRTGEGQWIDASLDSVTAAAAASLQAIPADLRFSIVNAAGDQT